MGKSYTANHWADFPSGNTPMIAAKLNHLESQYDAAMADAVPRGGLVTSVDDYRGTLSDSAAINAALAASPHLTAFYPTTTTPGADYNFYGSGYINALGPRIQTGVTGNTTSDARPTLWVQKHSSVDRTVNPSEWDNGAIYGALIKESGSAYGSAVTGFARDQSANGGQLIGLHGRAYAENSTSQVWGGWSYAYAPDLGSGAVGYSIIGHEVDIRNGGSDQGWMASTAVGNSRGLVVVTADSSNPVSHGVYIGAGSGAPAGKMHTGLLFPTDGFVPSDAAISGTSVANNEVIRINGASTQANDYTGMRFYGGNLRTGISFAETSFENNAAILLGQAQRIVVGPGPGSSTYLAFDKTNAVANFSNMALQINGTQVVGVRKTGWAAPTGTASKATYATSTVTLPVLAGFVMALYNDFASHGLIGT